MQLTDISVIRDVLTRHGFSFSKSLGQNFLINPSVCPRMAAACHPDLEDGSFAVLEIGPGLGVLTRELSRVAAKVIIREDFRITAEPLHTNLIFDLVVPYDFPLPTDVVRACLTQEIKALSTRYFPVIQIDRNFVE